jgi:hypothetical protein
MSMRMNVYSVFDRASGVYDRPWCAHSDQAACRSFSDVACDADHPVGKHPDDFTLFRVGTWNDEKGELRASSVEKVINGAEAVAAAQKIKPGSLKDWDKEQKFGGSA